MATDTSANATGGTQVRPTRSVLATPSSAGSRRHRQQQQHQSHHRSLSHVAHEHHVQKARDLLGGLAHHGHRHHGRLNSCPALLVAAAPSVGGCFSTTTTTKQFATARKSVDSSLLDIQAVAEFVDDENDSSSDESGGSVSSLAVDDHDCHDHDDHDHDHDDLEAQRTEAIVLALALLLQAQEAADQDESGEGSVALPKTTLSLILDGFVKALQPTAAATTAATAGPSSREVENQMEQLFVSHANVFDEKVQNFIIQNFIQETDCAKVFRSAIRRTSLMKRCVKAMYPADLAAPVSPTLLGAPAAAVKSHWNQSLVLAAAQKTRDDTLEACPDIQSTTVVRTVKQLLATVSSWQFDLFALCDAVPGQTLLLVGNELLDKYELGTHFRTSKARQLDFLKQIQMKYHAHPYHNADHAADVAQTLHHFLSVGQVGETISNRSNCAALIAAIVHDVGHTSCTNNFHISTNDELAVQYVYRSPLEHMHCALAFQVMKSPTCDILHGLSRMEQMEVRTLIVDMVLATDNSVHAVYLGKFEDLLCRANEASTWTLSAQPDDERLVLQIALHAADVSNPAKSQDQCRRWAERIRLEFFQQGDRERELELQLSIGCDRENPIPMEKMQAGFILGIVRPLFTLFCQLPRTQLSHCVTQLDQNLAYWQSEITRTAAATQSQTLVVS